MSHTTPRQYARIVAEQHGDQTFTIPTSGLLSVVYAGDGIPRKLLVEPDGSVAARYVYQPNLSGGSNVWRYQPPLPGDDADVGTLGDAPHDVSLTAEQESAIQRLERSIELQISGYAPEGDGLLVIYPHQGTLAAVHLARDGVLSVAAFRERILQKVP